MYLMKSKDEVVHAFKNFHKMVETKFDRKIRIFHFANGGEYTSEVFQGYLHTHKNAM